MQPAYVSLDGAATLPVPAPYRSRGLSNLYFPLPCDLGRLRAFCDQHINFAGAGGLPEEMGVFEPILPLVFLVVTHQPHVNIGAGDYGWFSQHELTVGFLAEWRRKRGGRWAYEGCPFVVPYIYVDSSLALNAGREIHGWPKQMATFEGWIPPGQEPGPGQGQRLAVSTLVIPGQEGAGYSERTLLEIEGRSPLQTDLGADPRGGMASLLQAPLQAWQAAASWPGLWRYALGPLARNPFDAGSWLDRAQTLGLWPQPGLPILTLKQFRDIEQPGAACYQALIHSVMGLDRIHGFGPQAPLATMMGDLSGGYRLRLHQHSTQPIVEQLGIQVTRTERTADGTEVAVLTPICPYWVGFDFTHGPDTQVLGWRSGSSTWQTLESRAPGSDSPGSGAAPGATPVTYNASRDQAETCQPGPFELAEAQLHLLVLPADPDVLRAACLQHLGGPTTLELELIEPLVVLTLVTGQQQSLPTGRRWSTRWLSCHVPVRLNGSPTLLAPYEFGGDPITTVTARELEGRALALAEIGGSWAGPSGDADLLRVRTTAFPYLAADVKAGSALLMQVGSTPPTGQRKLPAAVERFAEQWLPHASPGARFDLTVTGLKQYRDAARVDRAAYQAIVERPITVVTSGEPARLGPLTVTLGDPATFPLERTLGLGSNGRRSRGGGHLAAGWGLTARLLLGAGRTLLTREPDGQWQRRPRREILMPPTDLRNLGGRYRLDTCFAEGGMSSLWRAFDLQLQRAVAVKMLRTPQRPHDELLASFEAEALAIARLQHPNVVQIHDYGIDDGEPYMVMELLEGEDLGARLRRLRRLPLGAVAGLVQELASALTAAHTAGLVHADLKPGNVFLSHTATGEVVKVLDFGLAPLLGRLGGSISGPRLISSFAGSPHFMSPEQATGGGPVDHRSDLWSLGVIAYFALTGELPFKGPALRDLVLAICTAPVVTASSLVPGLSPEVDTFFERALARDRTRRFQSARELAVGFARLLETEGRTAKILVVDDEPDLADLFRQRFRREIRQQVYEFVFAGDGGAALEQLDRHPDIEVVCTDIRMPNLDGLTLLGRVREQRPTTSVIVVSAFGDMVNVRTAMNRGAFDFVTKPIDLEDLEATLRKTVSYTRQQRRGSAEHHLLRLLSRGLVGDLLPKLWATEIGASETFETTVAVLGWRGLRVPDDEDGRRRWRQHLTIAFERVVGEVSRQRGRVDRLDGELMILAFRGEDHMQRTLDACEAIRRAFGPMMGTQLPAFAFGVCSGWLTLTALGSRAMERLECLPVGDPVTIARQLCLAAEDGQILLPAALAAALDITWTVRPAQRRSPPSPLEELAVMAVERRAQVGTD